VLNLLSSNSTPIALRMESWLPDPSDPGLLQRALGHCSKQGSLPAGGVRLPCSAAGGVIGRAMAEGRAGVSTDLADGPPDWSQALRDAGLGSVLALPVVAEGQVGEVLALYF
jgi:hypothetical protein